jgi:hypothetical protein
MKLKPADFAREAGVTRQAVGAKIKSNTLIIDPAGFLDTENPVNSAYISARSRSGRRAAPGPAPASPANPATPGPVPPSPPPIHQGFDISAAAGGIPAELLSLTLREIVLKYNGLYNLEKHAKILRDLTMASEKDQRIQERSLKLIDKDFVTSRLFQYVDVLMKQLIEYPEAAVDSIVAKVLSDGPDARADIIISMRDALGRIIAGAKEQIIKELNGLKGKYNGMDKLEEINKAIREAVSIE